jgi:quinol monooxygenase YgiN
MKLKNEGHATVKRGKTVINKKNEIAYQDEYGEGEQITLVCLVKAKQAKRRQVRKKLLQLAEKTHMETGNINYDVHVSASDDSMFIVYENWRGRVALNSHMDKPYVKNFLDSQKELLEYPVDGRFCKLIKLKQDCLKGSPICRRK